MKALVFGAFGFRDCGVWWWFSHSVISNFSTPWTLTHQAPLSMGFPRQEYRSDLPFPPPGDLPNLGIKPRSPALQADSLLTEPPGRPGEDMWTFTSHFPEEKSTLREGNPFAQVYEKFWVWAEANLGLAEYAADKVSPLHSATSSAGCCQQFPKPVSLAGPVMPQKCQCCLQGMRWCT